MEIIDKNKIVELIYINDLCRHFIKILDLTEFSCEEENLVGHNITVMELANLIKMFKLKIDNKNNFYIKSEFESNLFETFKSYLSL